MSWRSIELSTHLASLPAMLGAEERQFLYWLGCEAYSGAGEIVDLGSFLGGSAACLAAGVQANGRAIEKTSRVHSFDRFEFADYHRPFLPGFSGPAGASTLPEFEQNVAPYAPIVRAYVGDICTQRWDRPIEILFVDFTRSWQDHDALAAKFYRRLIPGRSILVHQDYIYVLCYWLHAFMEFYAGCFEFLEPHVLYGTAAWRLRKKLPAKACWTPLYRRLSVDDIGALIDRSIGRYRTRLTDDNYMTPLLIARCRFEWHARGRTAAKRMIERLGLDPAQSHTAQFLDELATSQDDSPQAEIFRQSGISPWRLRARSLFRALRRSVRAP
jgi:hypothetical protein